MLKIFKGDDTGGAFGRTLVFKINVGDGVSLIGCRAEFIFDGITKAFAAPLVAGESREIFYSHNETALMALGTRNATFRIIDAAGKIRTFDNTIKVCVTDDVTSVYPGETDTASVTIGAGISWDLVTDKPKLVKTVNGQEPDEAGNVNVEGGTGGNGIKIIELYIDENRAKVLEELKDGERTGKKITRWNELYPMVMAGNVRLYHYATGTTGRKALYTAHLTDDAAIRFDATGLLGNQIFTRSIALTEKADGGISINIGDITEILGYNRKVSTSTIIGTVVETLADGMQNAQAIIKEFTIPARLVLADTRMCGFRLRGASTDSGTWDKEAAIYVKSTNGTTSMVLPFTMPINTYAKVVGNNYSLLKKGADIKVKFVKDPYDLNTPAAVRVSLAKVDPSLGFITTFQDGSLHNDYAPLFEIFGFIENREEAMILDDVFRVHLGTALPLPSNATQFQLIAKVNELIKLMKGN